MKSTDIYKMNPSENPPPGPEPGTPAPPVLGAPEMAGLWPDFPRRSRRMLLAAAGRQWFELWRDGARLSDVPPRAWGWRLGAPGGPLTAPAGLLERGPARLSHTRLVGALAMWLHDGGMPWSPRERLCVLSAFAGSGALGRAARRHLARRVERAARRIASERAREVYRDVLAETEHLCRQAVGCRAIWLPDTSLPAGGFREGIEAALHAPSSEVIKHSEIALVVRARLFGEDVVIKRHRFARAGKRLKYLWRMSRARRAWAAGLTLRRLGLPAAEPVGLFETIRAGRVTDSYIITRWLPGCRTAGDAAEALGDEAGRRGAVAAWRGEWLRLLDRGIYHADTKLSNAMVQQGGPGPAPLFWTDLECVSAGGWLTPYRLLRNVVQMNGSLSAGFPLDDRLDFLRGLPPQFGWLRKPWCLWVIAKWTQRRSR